MKHAATPVDTIRARVQLLGRCALAGARLLDGGTSPSGADLRLRVRADEPCFGCTLSAHQRSVSDLPWSCAEPLPDELPQASAIATTAVAGGWLCAAAFGVLFGAVPYWRLLSVDVEAGRAGAVEITRDPRCPLHRPLDGPLVTSAAAQDSAAGEFLAGLRDGDEAYTWNSFALPVVCRHCGYAPVLDGELAPWDVRPCPKCGAALRQARSTRLRDADPGATLAALGVAPEEILPVQTEGGEMECHQLRATARPMIASSS